MKLLFCSYSFSPCIGGIETVSDILAREFVEAGLSVTVVTNTPGPDMGVGYRIVRGPSWQVLRRLAAESDLIFQNNISLQLLLPTFLSRKPVVVLHQTWLTRMDGQIAWQDKIKRFTLRACHNVSISQAIASSLPVKSIVVPNPFDESSFSQLQNVSKSEDIVFMGRLVSDKGCDQVLHALIRLKEVGLTPNFNVIGNGEELIKLRALVEELGLADQVKFFGALRENRGLEVARHKIMVIPSKWNEPFGVVALEGIAAGCSIVASAGGGLPDAVGPCGLLYPNDDVDALAKVLERLLRDPNLRVSLLSHKEKHLATFQPRTIAMRYIEYFKTLIHK